MTCLTIVNHLQTQWTIDNTSPRARTTYRQWALRHDLLDQCANPAELAIRITKSDPPTANALIGILLEETRHGDLLARQTCLHAFIPLIMSTIKRCHANQYGRATDDFAADMIVAALDIIDRIANEYTNDMAWPITVFASRLLHRAQRARTRETSYENHISPYAYDTESHTGQFVATPRTDPGTELVNFLAAAVERNTISRDEARLVGARALLDQPVITSCTDTAQPADGADGANGVDGAVKIGPRGIQKRHRNLIDRLRQAATDITDTMVA